MSERVSNGVVAEEQVVADVVVDVREEVRADGGGDDFAAVVVQPYFNRFLFTTHNAPIPAFLG